MQEHETRQAANIFESSINDEEPNIFKDLALSPEPDTAEPPSSNIPPQPGPENSSGGWFEKSNPLYLLSVLFMLLGLHLVSSDAQASNISVEELLAFFAVQNLYEIIMVAMALYLLKNQLHASHGKLLLLFVMLFLGDVTFYQVRISGLSVFYGNLATLIYMALALVKLAAVIKILGLTIYHWRIFYVASSFALIWVGPKVAYNIVDSVGKASSSYFDATTIIYLLWLVAGLIHLPLVIQNWKHSRLSDEVKHPLVGDETVFWRYLMIFPMVIMPLQLFLNVMTDSSITLSRNTPAVAMFLPWLICTGFFVQALWRKQIQSAIGLNSYDSGLLGFALIMVIATTQAEQVPVIINFVLVTTGLLITFITRSNALNGLALSLIVVYFTGKQLLESAKTAINYGSTLSKTAWAVILMTGSFITLGLGFLFSIHKKPRA